MIAALKKERRNPYIITYSYNFPPLSKSGFLFRDDGVAMAVLFHQIQVFGMFLDIPGDERAQRHNG